jgi:TldD protein
MLASHRIDYADLYFQHQCSEAWSLEEGIVKSGSFNIEQGVGVRAIQGEKTAFAYSDEISLPALEAAARATRAIAAQGQSLTARAVNTRAPRPLYSAENPAASLTDTAKVKLLERLESYARAEDSRVSQVMAHIAGTHEVVMVMRNDGHMAADVRPLVRVSVTVIMQDGTHREQGSSGGGGRFDYSYFTDDVLRDYAARAVHQARVNLAARPAPGRHHERGARPGLARHPAARGDRPRAGGRFQPQGQFAFAGRMGQQVASRGVTVVDDGTLPNRRGSLTVDDEGNPTRCTTLIEDGILVGYMQDSLNARLMGVAPTGNGRRESFAHLPMPRMTNTYMLNGDRDPEEIIRSVKKGLYAVNFGGGQVDITSGKFVFSGAEVYMIENGRVTYPIKGATLIGNGPDALTRVSMIGNDMALDSGVGTCGKEGQSVPVGVGQPTLRIDGLTVGGTA